MHFDSINESIELFIRVIFPAKIRKNKVQVGQGRKGQFSYLPQREGTNTCATGVPSLWQLAL